jgi:hypothetical protein
MFCPGRQGHKAQLFCPKLPTRATLAEMADPTAGAGLQRMLCLATDLSPSGLNGMARSPILTSFLVDRANPARCC